MNEDSAGNADKGVEVIRLAANGAIPNNPARPLLLYRGAIAIEGGHPAVPFEKRFAANGWSGGWRNGIYSRHHYHATAHEVLGIARGEARVRFGGEGGPVVAVKAGDVVVVPAGVGHKNEGASPDLLVVGAYAGGRRADMHTDERDDRPRVDERVAAVPVPSADPIHGADGPLVRYWGQAPR